ncbi:MAG TPA: stage II sporulation protein M [Gammaproteobacteria bacterium]|nr:stage II sporulation protein M [Gammaproteobacteria bacterium]
MKQENNQREAIGSWLQRRHERWQGIERYLRTRGDIKYDDASEVLQFAEEFRGLSNDLALAQAVLPGNRITRYLETLLHQAHETMYRKPERLLRSIAVIVRTDTPRILGELRGALQATVSIFLCCGVAGWLLVHYFPELAGLFVSEDMINTVQTGKLWTDDLLNILPSSVLSFSIISNNVSVTLFAFVCGCLYGLGTFYLIALNGLMLGGTFAFTREYGMDGRLFEFIVAHGVVELSVICIAGALGMGLGEALARPGIHPRAVAFRLAVHRSAKVLVTVVPFLIGAGIIEGFISPDPRFDLLQRSLIGFGFFLVFWLTITGRIWKLRLLFPPRARTATLGAPGANSGSPA